MPGFDTLANAADLIISITSSSEIPLTGLNSISGKISNDIGDLMNEFPQVVHLSPFWFIKGFVLRHL